MSAIRIILALSLALVLSFTLVGCNDKIPQDEIDRIIENVLNAQFDSVRMDMDMTATVEVIGGPEPGEITMFGDGTGVMDITNQEMRMTMNMTVDIPELGVQTMVSKVYLVGDWMYTGVEIAEFGEQWFKTEAMPGMWEQQSQLDQQIAFLKTAVEVKSLPDQAVDGTDCYVFEIVPSVEALGELLSQQSSAMGNMDFSQMNLADLFQEMKVKEWIARDNYQVLKTEVYMLMQMLPEDVGATGADFDKMLMGMNMTTKLYDYNQPVSINLPEAALNASEMPY
ncbi:MAG: hypothetical protein HQ588_04635 [Deltaproteobacteria bacterium]|nr:hypothetical protein [Deltaproteobacteria bacterium]